MKIILGFLLILSLSSVSFAQERGDPVLAMARAEKAVSTLKTFSALKKDLAPVEVFSKAKAVGVFSEARLRNLLFDETVDARGVISVRSGEKWSTPLFASFGSLGLSTKLIGKEKTYDIIFFVMDEKSVTSLKKGKIKLKLTPGTALSKDNAESVIKKASVIYYVIGDGKLSTNGKFFSGVTSLIVFDNKSNKRVYNQTRESILAGEPNSLPILPSAAQFHQTIGELLASKE